MPGPKSHGFHEGSRSEYLAQYVFASWGTAVVIPQQEDHGIDIHCTLMERVGKLLLAKSPYTVQVKSNMQPWVLTGEKQVRWVIEHPLPLFLCVVHKASARLSIYNTLARFHAWALGQWPNRLSMTPAPAVPGREGKCGQWPGSYEFSLDQPILDFSITDMLKKAFWQKSKAVFERWVEIENENLARVRAQLPTCRMPHRYKTNDTWQGGWLTLSLNSPGQEQFEKAIASLNESVQWVSQHLLAKGDVAGAAKAALLHRHLFPEELPGLSSLVQRELNERLADDDGPFYAGVDHLAGVVRSLLQKRTKKKAPRRAKANAPTKPRRERLNSARG